MMASQPKIEEAPVDEGAQTPPNDNDGTTPERDYEAEAREHGWSPKDEFKGDPSRWVDAETFIKRADEMMPLLKADRDRIKRELDDLKRQMRKAADHFSKAEERAYERARKELEGRLDKAVLAGDTVAAREVGKEIETLSKEVGGASGEALNVPEAEAREAHADFLDDNPWYQRAERPGADDLYLDARDYADRQIQRHLEKTKQMRPADFFAFIADQVHAKFPELKSGRTPARQKPTSQVDGGGQRSAGKRGGKTFADLPPEAQKIADKWVKQGLIKDRETYVKSYQWD